MANSDYLLVVRAGEIANQTNQRLHITSYSGNVINSRRDKRAIPEFLSTPNSPFKYAIEAVNWLSFAHRINSSNGNAEWGRIGEIFTVASRKWDKAETTLTRLEKIYTESRENYTSFVQALIDEPNSLDLSDSVRQSARLPLKN